MRQGSNRWLGRLRWLVRVCGKGVIGGWVRLRLHTGQRLERSNQRLVDVNLLGLAETFTRHHVWLKGNTRRHVLKVTEQVVHGGNDADVDTNYCLASSEALLCLGSIKIRV